MVATALVSAGDDGDTIPSGPIREGTKSSKSLHVGNNDWIEVVSDDPPPAVFL